MTPRDLALVVAAPLALLTSLAVAGAFMVRSLRGILFMRAIAAEVARQLPALRPDWTDGQVAMAARIIAAQAGLETDDGATIAWREGFNFGNVTAGSDWTGPVTAGGDTAPDASGLYVPIVQSFRRYSSLASAVEDYLFNVLTWERERAAGVWDALSNGDATAYATALHTAGYYTAPIAAYAQGISQRLDRLA